MMRSSTCEALRSWAVNGCNFAIAKFVILDSRNLIVICLILRAAFRLQHMIHFAQIFFTTWSISASDDEFPHLRGIEELSWQLVLLCTYQFCRCCPRSFFVTATCQVDMLHFFSEPLVWVCEDCMIWTGLRATWIVLSSNRWQHYLFCVSFQSFECPAFWLAVRLPFQNAPHLAGRSSARRFWCIRPKDQLTRC